MKLPSISLNFFKKPPKKKRIITTLGKRTSSASSSTAAKSRKAHRSSSTSNSKSRKRSITYYAPSKSKFYPSEHFPSMQRLVRHKTAVAPTTPLVPRSYSYEQQPTASTDIDSKLNDNSGFSVVNETLHSYTAKQIYSYDNDYGDIVVHQPPAWYVPSNSQSPPPPPHVACGRIDQNIVAVNNNDEVRRSSNHRMQSRFYPNVESIDFNANKLYDDNYLNNAYVSTYSKERVMQGVSIQSRNANTIPIVNDSNYKYNIANNIDTELCTQQIQNAALQPNIANAYDANKLAIDSINGTHAKYTRSNSFPIDNTGKLYSVYQSTANQSTPRTMHGFPIYGAQVPFKKKSDRHRRRKVRNSEKEIACKMNSMPFAIYETKI